MRRISRTLVVVTTGAMLVGSLAGTALAQSKSKEVSAAKYAKTMCTTYNTVLDDVVGFADELAESTESDPAAFQAEVDAARDDVIDALETADKKLKSVYPDVDGGKKIGKQFAKNASELQDAINEAVDEFVAADPTSPAFSGDVTILSVSLTTLQTQLSDVTAGITNQDFIGAVGDEKSCQEIFPVTGG